VTRRQRFVGACAAASVAIATFGPPVLRAQPPRPRLFPPQDLGLLSAPDRDQWNRPDLIMDALNVFDGASVAELGAGGGWFTIRLSRRVGPNGIVYAEDIQPQMIEAIGRRAVREGLTNVRTVLGTPANPQVPAGLDAVVIVDAYHEMEDPVTLLTHVQQALKPQGRLGVVEYLPGGGGPGPAADERVNPDLVIAAATTAGLTLVERENISAFMYLLVFGRAEATRPPS
jgi:predicted methyltransferase